MLHPLVWFTIAVLTIGLVMKTAGFMERFDQPVYDRSQDARTEQRMDSSFEQVTNHMTPTYDLGTVSGMATPFRVNQYTAFVS